MTTKKLEKLQNGARIIDQAPSVLHPNGTVVLAEWRGPVFGELVCWIVDVDGNAFWGHYGPEALPSFEQRAGRPAGSSGAARKRDAERWLEKEES